ncbi:hypothetical protein M4I21_17110 [Cellulophaga sp. 20_2_10]|uniref:hypothetical protein n=1 Tax=Cellulophaga sp. 20_2_10 TaxID=2942476 RepID=UPI00201A6210|nr:hypothetical protein [Cellulophaga sp. 20_2_10]MCL5247544.1 hypothetical protein [Cellulophaga sp. 20_2_10]
MHSLSRYIKTNNGLEIDIISPLKPKEYEVLFANEILISKLVDIANLYSVTELNSFILFNSKQELTSSLMADRVLIMKEPDSEKLKINTYLLNYLFSFRTYIDHLETLLKREFKTKPEILEEFKNLTGTLYDDSFEYRFIYKLRNYAQHCGLPIDIFEIKSSIIEDVYSVEIEIKFNVSLLLSKFEWGNPLKSNLESLDGNIDVMDTVISFHNLVQSIQNWFVKIISEYLNPIQDLLNQKTNEKNTNPLGLCITYKNEDGELCVVDSVFRYLNQIKNSC